MALDPQPLGQLAVQMMELLDARFGEEADELEFEAMMILVAVRVPDPNSDMGGTAYQWVAMDPSFHGQLGLITAVQQSLITKGMAQA